MSGPQIARELAGRAERYASASDDFAFMEALGQRLDPIERSLEHDAVERAARIERPLPTLFVVGPPRSGTTLVMQCLLTRFEMATTTNFLARFWRTPFVGLRLQRILDVRTGRSDFKSDHGKTGDPGGPHEFSYFWREALQLWDSNVGERRSLDAARMRSLATRLSAMTNEAGLPFLHKGMLIQYDIEAVCRALPDASFLILERDRFDIACSLLNARRSYYGDPNRWWSMFVPNQAYVETLPWPDQIARQVHYVGRLLDRAKKATADRHVTVSYEDFCRNPLSTLGSFASLVKACTGYSLVARNGVPHRFDVSRPRVSATDAGELRRALEAADV